MPEYDLEAVDKLPFSTPEKAQRYQTENYRGAMGLNWYLTDPTLQFIMAYYRPAAACGHRARSELVHSVRLRSR